MKLAFTVCSVSHLGQAKAMADSFLKFNPDYTMAIGIVDRLGGRIEEAKFKDYLLFSIEEIGIPNLSNLLLKYDTFEMCGLIRPYLAEFLLNKFGEVEKLIYIDTDILLFNSVQSIEEELNSAEIVITPHTFVPYENNELYPKEINLLNSGLYNSGFFAIQRSEETIKFLKWWQNRLSEFGFVNFMDGMFVDQLWINLVPLFFKNVRISENLGLNVGYWNLHERHIQLLDEQYFVNGKYPLIFFHYSGYKTSSPDKISVHTDRFDLQNRPELQPIFALYHEQLLLNKHEEFLEHPNLLIPEKKYKKWGKLREYALRISRKLIRELHG